MSATTHEHVLKALEGLVPEEARDRVSAAVTSLAEGAVKELEKEYEQRLEEAYEELRKDKAEAERVAEEGYAQAWDAICSYRDRLELQNEEFERALDAGFEEAYQKLLEERKKNDTLETELYEEFEAKLGDVKKFVVTKLDQFLQMQGDKYYEMARCDLLNDPVFAEHKQAFDRMLEAAATVLSDEDFAAAGSGKAEKLLKENEELKVGLKTLEGKNMRLSMENNKLNESVRQTKSLLTESASAGKKERVEKAKKAEGRGKVELDRQVVIGEYNGEPVKKSGEDDSLVEEVGQDVFSYWKHLSGVDKVDENE